MLSEKGLPLKVIDGFKFRKCRATQEGQRWRCTAKKCRSYVVTDLKGDVIIRRVIDHTHPSCSNLHRQIISNAVKRKAGKDYNSKQITKLIHSELTTVEPYVKEVMTSKDINLIKNNVYNGCSKRFFVNPQADEMDIGEGNIGFSSTSRRRQMKDRFSQLEIDRTFKWRKVKTFIKYTSFMLVLICY